MHSPAFLKEIGGVVGSLISGVALQVGIVVQSALEDGEELMSLLIGVV